MTKPRAAARGSQMWMQRMVQARNPILERAIAVAVGRPLAEVVWKAPLAPTYAEPRDGRVFDLLDERPSRRALKDFWPQRGPVWDAIAVVEDQYVLFEAKAHIPELISGPSKAVKSASVSTIRRSLDVARRALAPRSKVDWATSPFFQYANRLAFLHYLREDNGFRAHLAFVYITHDDDMHGPESVEAWMGAVRLMEASLGISEHRLSPFVHKIFVDSRGICAEPSSL